MSNYSAVKWLCNGGATVTICGSTKFFSQIMECNRRLTFWINKVYLVGSFGHSYHLYHKPVESSEGFEGVKKLHYIKILHSNCIVVVTDKSGYIGDSTKAEIKFAEYIKIPVFYFDGEEFTGSTDILPPEKFDYKTVDKFDKINGGLGY